MNFLKLLFKIEFRETYQLQIKVSRLRIFVVCTNFADDNLFNNFMRKISRSL